MKCAIYCRVSTDEGKQTTQNQLRDCTKYAEAMGWTITHQYEEYASGSNGNRPQFQKLLSEVRQRHIDVILVWALDRFSREGPHKVLGYVQQLKHYRCGLVSLQERWLDTHSEGISELMLGIISWFAKEERRRISERTKAGLQRARSQGKRLGRPPKKRTPA